MQQQPDGGHIINIGSISGMRPTPRHRRLRRRQGRPDQPHADPRHGVGTEGPGQHGDRRPGAHRRHRGVVRRGRDAGGDQRHRAARAASPRAATSPTPSSAWPARCSPTPAAPTSSSTAAANARPTSTSSERIEPRPHGDQDTRTCTRGRGLVHRGWRCRPAREPLHDVQLGVLPQGDLRPSRPRRSSPPPIRTSRSLSSPSSGRDALQRRRARLHDLEVEATTCLTWSSPAWE